jgi:hypothetical protein
MWLITSIGCPLQIAESRKPIHIIAKSFPVFPTGRPVLWFLAAVGLLLLTDSRNWHAVTNSFELKQETYSHYWQKSSKPIPAIRWLVFPLSAICSRSPMEMDKLHFFVLKVHLHEIFRSPFLHLSNTYRLNNKASEFFRFCSWIHRLIQIFLTFGSDSVYAESYSLSTESSLSETPHQLTESTWVRLHVNWVNAEW